MSSLKKIVVVGASGRLGGPLLQALLAANTFEVSVLSRASSDATFPAGVRVVRADYGQHAQLVAALAGQDAVVSAAGHGGFLVQKALVDAAVEAGVRRFVPSEFGGSPTSPESLELLPAVKDQNEVRDYLKSKEGQGNGFSWTSLSTGAWFDWCIKVKFLDFDLEKAEALIWDGGNTRFSSTTFDQVLLSVVRILQRPEATANKRLVVASFSTTQQEVLRLFEETSGKKWTVQHTTREAQIQLAREGLAKGDFSAFKALILAAAVYAPDADLSKRGLDNELLGLEPVDLKATIESLVKSG